jgi:hypothetical protein
LEQALAALHKLEASATAGGLASQHVASGELVRGPAAGDAAEAGSRAAFASKDSVPEANELTKRGAHHDPPDAREAKFVSDNRSPHDVPALSSDFTGDKWLSPTKATSTTLAQNFDASFSGFDDFGADALQAAGGAFDASFGSFDNVLPRSEPAGADGFGDFDSFGTSEMPSASVPARVKTADDWSMSF